MATVIREEDREYRGGVVTVESDVLSHDQLLKRVKDEKYKSDEEVSCEVDVIVRTIIAEYEKTLMSIEDLDSPTNIAFSAYRFNNANYMRTKAEYMLGKALLDLEKLGYKFNALIKSNGRSSTVFFEIKNPFKDG